MLAIQQRTMPSTSRQQSWLKQVVNDVITWLARQHLSPELRLRHNPDVRRGYSGWYSLLGTLLDGGGGPCAFLDRSLDGKQLRLWVGFWSPTQEGIERVVSSAAGKWNRVFEEEDARNLGQDAFKFPWLEHAVANETYFGFYQQAKPEIGKRLSPKVVSRLGRILLALQPESSKSGSGNTSLSKRTFRSIKLRQGQPKFRAELLKQYGHRCCVSGSTVTDVLEAAHIATFPGADLHSPSNGLLLRSDLHTLFDLGLLRIHPKTLVVHISPDAFYKPYKSLHGKRLRIGSECAKLLDRHALQRRWAETLNLESRPQGTAK